MNTIYEPKIVGVFGLSGSGKDEVGDHLEQRGYLHFSQSNCLRTEAATRGLDTQRTTLRELGQTMRIAEGSGALAMRGIAHWQRLVKELSWLSIAVSGHFTLGEAEVIQGHGGNLWLVQAPDELRFEREKERNRNDTFATIDAMRAHDQIELQGLTGSDTPNIGAVMRLPNITVIENNGTVEELHAKVDELVEGYSIWHDVQCA